jgi:hypothetical protein
MHIKSLRLMINVHYMPLYINPGPFTNGKMTLLITSHISFATDIVQFNSS